MLHSARMLQPLNNISVASFICINRAIKSCINRLDISPDPATSFILYICESSEIKEMTVNGDWSENLYEEVLGPESGLFGAAFAQCHQLYEWKSLPTINEDCKC